MKSEIMGKLKAVQDALENINVCGKKNVTLMTGVMNIIDEISFDLSKCEINYIQKDEKVEN